MIAFSLSGCDSKLVEIDQGAGLSDEVFQPVPVYDRKPTTVGTLTEGYIQNTTGLITANSRLKTICIAYDKCDEDGEPK